MIDFTNRLPDLGTAPVSFGDEPSLLGAKFRQETTIGSIASSNYWSERLMPTDDTPLDIDGVAKRLQQDGLDQYAPSFRNVRTVGIYDAIKKDILKEQADKQVIADTGIMGNLGGSLVVGLADPVNWIPAGRAFTMARGGAGLLNVAGQAALTFGGIAAAGEPIFQATQQTRSLMDGFSHIAAATILGGVVGTGAYAINTPAFRQMAQNVQHSVTDWLFQPNYLQIQTGRAEEAYNAILQEIATNPQGPRRIHQGPLPTGQAGYSARIPSVEQISRRTEAFDALQAAEDRMGMWHDNSMATTGPLEWVRTIGQRGLGRAFGSGWLDPSDYILKRTSTVEGKLALQNLVEVVQLLNKNVERGVPTPQSATQGMDKFVGGWASFRDGMWGGSVGEAAQRALGLGDSYWIQARNAGFTDTQEAFERQVARAVVNGHVDPAGNPGVTAAAQAYKKFVSDPIKELAESAGYLVPNTPRFALGHMPRQWVRPAVQANDEGAGFRARVADAYFQDRMLDLQSAALASGVPVTATQRGATRRWAAGEANRTYRRIMGIEQFEDGGFLTDPQHLAPNNPFEARVVPIQDAELIDRGWVNYNITDVANYQTRAVVPRLLVASKFRTRAGDPDPFMQSTLDRIRQEYSTLQAGRGATPSAVTGLTAPEANAQLNAIRQEGDNVIDVLERLRDGFVRGPGFSFDGRWKTAEHFIYMAKLYQVTRLMGNLVTNSLSDVSNLLMRNGYGTFFKGMIDDMTRNGLFNVRPSTMMDRSELMAEAKRWGAATEWATNASMGAHADILAPYQTGPFTNTMHNIGRAFSVMNLAQWWNDFMRLKAFRAGMDRILEATETPWADLPQHMRLSMNQVGLGEQELQRIGAAWQGQTNPANDGFLRFAYMSQWQDRDAVRLMADALAKDNASTVVRTRVGDFNSMAKNNPLVGLITQFQNFIFSHSLRVLTLAEQRVIQEYGWGPDSARIYGGIAMHLGFGMLSAYLMDITHDLILGERPGKGFRTDERLKNPGKWIADGIDKSGVLGMFGQFNTVAERLKIPGISQGLGALMGDQSHEVSVQKGHWMDRDPLQVLLGPTISQSADIAKMGVHLANDKFGRTDLNNLFGAAPFGNHVAFRLLTEPLKAKMAEDLLGIPYQR